MVGLRGAQVFVMKFDKQGNALWSDDVRAADWGVEGLLGDTARAIRVDPADGSLLVAGNFGGVLQGEWGFFRVDALSGEILEGTSLDDGLTWGDGFGTNVDLVHDFVIDGERLYAVGDSPGWYAQFTSRANGSWTAREQAVVLSARHRPVWEIPEPAMPTWP
jgi:hypothetical protein